MKVETIKPNYELILSIINNNYIDVMETSIVLKTFKKDLLKHPFKKWHITIIKNLLNSKIHELAKSMNDINRHLEKVINDTKKDLS